MRRKEIKSSRNKIGEGEGRRGEGRGESRAGRGVEGHTGRQTKREGGKGEKECEWVAKGEREKGRGRAEPERIKWMSVWEK